MRFAREVKWPPALLYKEADVNPAMYISLGVLWVMIFIMIYRQNRVTQIRRIINRKRNKKETRQMKELAQKFIGKECLVYTFNNQVTGTLIEVTDGAILLDNGKDTEAVNMDYVVRIREYPKNKNGKKKSVVLD